MRLSRLLTLMTRHTHAHLCSCTSPAPRPRTPARILLILNFDCFLFFGQLPLPSLLQIPHVAQAGLLQCPESWDCRCAPLGLAVFSSFWPEWSSEPKLSCRERLVLGRRVNYSGSSSWLLACFWRAFQLSIHLHVSKEGVGRQLPTSLPRVTQELASDSVCM